MPKVHLGQLGLTNKLMNRLLNIVKVFKKIEKQVI